MADFEISQLASKGSPGVGDLLVLVDVSDLATPPAGAAGSNKSVTYANLIAGLFAEQFQCLSGTRTFTNNTSAQAIFNATANGALTVQANTTYEFECRLDVTGFSASSHTINFGLGGTATFTSIGYDAITATSAGGAASIFPVASAAATAITAATTTTTLQALIKGTMRINAGGTIIPQITQVTNSAAAVVAATSQFRAWPKGSGSITNFGNWS